MNPQPADPTLKAFPGSNAFGGSESTSLHELRTLVLSRYAGIAIETGDEERARDLLTAVACDLGLTYVEWSIAQGMSFPGTGNYVPDSQTPAKALKAIDIFTGNALFVMMDFSRHLADPAAERQRIVLDPASFNQHAPLREIAAGHLAAL